jgi:hypothetical protein
MTRLILQPAGDPYARQHYADTVARPVPMEVLAKYLPPEDVEPLRAGHGDAAVPTWGVTPEGGM